MHLYLYIYIFEIYSNYEYITKIQIDSASANLYKHYLEKSNAAKLDVQMYGVWRW